VLLGPVADEIAKQYCQQFDVTRYEGPEDYFKSVERLFLDCDIFFSAAAVLDFESVPSERKIERKALKEMSELTIKIKAVPDIVAHFGKLKRPNQKVIAFAAESGTEVEIMDRAKAKMLAKMADAMIANPVWEGLGPDSDLNQVWVLRPGQKTQMFGPARKSELTRPILELLFGD